MTYPNSATKSRYFTNIGSTLTGGTGIVNNLEAPKIELIKGKTYVLTLSGITNTEFKFSITDNGTHNSGSELINSSIVKTDSTTYTITPNDTLSNALSSNLKGEKILYYYSTSNSDRALGGYFIIAESTVSPYDGNKNFGATLEHYYLTGRVIGFMDGNSTSPTTYANKTVLYVPKHGLSTTLQVKHQKTDWQYCINYNFKTNNKWIWVWSNYTSTDRWNKFKILQSEFINKCWRYNR